MSPDLTHQPEYFMGEKNLNNYFKHTHIIFELILVPYHAHKYCPNQTSMNMGAQETEGLPEQMGNDSKKHRVLRKMLKLQAN